MDDAYELVAANAAGIRPNLVTAVYARLLARAARRRRLLEQFPSAAAVVLQLLHRDRVVAARHSVVQPSEREGRCFRACGARAKVAGIAQASGHRGADVSIVGAVVGGRGSGGIKEAREGAALRRSSPMADGHRSMAARAMLTRRAKYWLRSMTRAAFRYRMRAGSGASIIC